MDSFAGITGIGLVTPLGDSTETTWNALISGQFITDHSRVLLRDAPSGPSVTALARRAAAEAIRHAQWKSQSLDSPSTALIVATSKGPVQEWLDGSVALDGLAAIAAGIADGLGLGSGPRLTVSAACCSGLHALIRATLMLREEHIDRVLVVGAEASVHPLFVGSFQRLGVLAPPGYGCRPFDLHRKGFLMSDAAAAICLERSPAPGDAPAMVRVENFAMAADATHITASDPAAAVLQRMLKQVIAGARIDLFHGHGTATVANDAVELNAIEMALRGSKSRPVLYSHKGAIGHSLGAAGLVAVVLSCLMHQQATVPPNVNLNDPLPTLQVELNGSIAKRPISRSIALAAGFGGPMAAISLVSE